MNTITIEMLKEVGSRPRLVKFIEGNGLVGMPFDLIKSSTCTSWVMEELKRAVEIYTTGKGKMLPQYFANKPFADDYFEYEFDEDNNKIQYRKGGSVQGPHLKWAPNGNLLFARYRSEFNFPEETYAYDYYSNGQLKAIYCNCEVYMNIPQF